MSLVIGIDAGTQSIKALVLNTKTKRVVAEARSTLTLISNLPIGHAEQHPKDWIKALDIVIKQVCKQVDSSKITSIGVSGQQHGFVPLDEQGHVIRPAKLWCDTSTQDECDILTKKLGGEEAVIRSVGLPFRPGYTAPKILWLKRNEPRNFARLRHILLPHDYLNWYLTGNYTMEYGDASGSGLLDIRNRVWSKPVLQAIDQKLERYLPLLQDSSKPAGFLSLARAKAYGLSPKVIVSAGGGDNMMGAIGTGNVTEGIVTASFGTSGTIYATATKPIIDPLGEIAAFCSSSGDWLPLLCTMNVTTVTEKVRALFTMDLKALDKAVSASPVGSHPLVFLPYIAGERTPNIPDASGVLFGLTANAFDPAYIARSAMEGVTLGMNYGLLRLAKLGVKPKEIRVTGGGAKSAAWRQIMADVFGLPVVAMKEDEGAALGAAIQSAWCRARAQGNTKAKLTEFTQGVVALNEKTRCKPIKSHVMYYAKMQALHNELSHTLRPLFEAHKALRT